MPIRGKLRTLSDHQRANLAGAAPSAIRTPISCVRSLTAYAITP
jgi:hypothetical protein